MQSVEEIVKSHKDLDKVEINLIYINEYAKKLDELISDLVKTRYLFRPTEVIEALANNLSYFKSSYNALDTFAKKNNPEYAELIFTEILKEEKLKISERYEELVENYGVGFTESWVESPEKKMAAMTTDYENLKDRLVFNLKGAYKDSHRFRKWFAYVLTYAKKKSFEDFNRINKLMGFTSEME